jgi:membrane-associated phospholipid phosphatase
MLSPTRADMWIARELASRMGRHQLFDLAVQSGIVHGIFGGVCFGAVLFFWVSRLQVDDEEAQRKFEITILASLAAVALAKLASLGLQWPAPNKYGDLSVMFPEYIVRSDAGNCFPSESTAAYGAIAAGVFAWRRHLGVLLWIGVMLLIALPRMYVGGHFLLDVLVGAGCALGGYGFAWLLARWSRPPALIRGAGRWQGVVSVAVFIYIWQVSVEFREVLWFFNFLRYLI